MGPVLESVLGSLTQEYEKRLLAKDHEVKAARLQLEHFKREAHEAQAALTDARRMLPAPPAPGQPASNHNKLIIDFNSLLLTFDLGVCRGGEKEPLPSDLTTGPLLQTCELGCVPAPHEPAFEQCLL